ncbi:hypothetical protein VFPBJ_05101 [Purpureocillium lilacinum]|uniref:Uncharacterized protein n=1 Tax=Purpureocillium lilacinum TaxID=33203 RepID=A0A179GX17_PURLI|nr:hypothetical protein VFPBJ_05101 [Purpureocillium lilacinum]
MEKILQLRLPRNGNASSALGVIQYNSTIICICITGGVGDLLIWQHLADVASPPPVCSQRETCCLDIGRFLFRCQTKASERGKLVIPR